MIIDVDEQNNIKFLETEMNKNENERLCGFIKCKILPPRSLYFPILPVRIENKLIFPLCLECARLKNNGLMCDHNANQRSFMGT